MGKINRLISLTLCLSIYLTNVKATESHSDVPEIPQNFPEYVELTLTKYINWAKEIVVENVWTAYPKDANEILLIANWARESSYQIRASGFMHTWAPITIFNSYERFAPQPDSNSTEPPRAILVKTNKYLTRMDITKFGTALDSSGEFWAETGIEVETMLKTLQEEGLGLLNHPAVGQITLGGALAIGAHGAGIKARSEIKSNGHTYGSLSNLVVSLEAVVYDREKDSYVLKRFHRSNEETKAFLVHLGRTFITNVTLRAGPLQYIRCISKVDVEAKELFASPSVANLNPTLRTFSSLLDKYGRVETITFPFVDKPWLKTFEVVTSTSSQYQHFSIDTLFRRSRRVIEPYNYFFSDSIPEFISDIVDKMTVGCSYYLAKQFGWVSYEWVNFQLDATRTRDIWGASPNIFLYVRPSTLRLTANGYAILTNRANLQRVLYQTYKVYNDTLYKYEREGKYPANGAFEIRASGVDDPLDVSIFGAESPTISATRPVEGKSDFDTVVWANVLRFQDTAHGEEFMNEMEKEYYSIFDGEWATIRVEWSKGWAYGYNTTWKDDQLLGKRQIQGGFKDWKFTADTLDKYDPQQVFSNPFLKMLF